MTGGNDNDQSDLRAGKCLGEQKSVTWENDNGQSELCEVHMSARPLQGELLSSFPSWLFRGIEQINDKINLNIENRCVKW